MDLPEVLKSALRLDVKHRAALAQELLASLEELSEEEIDQLWVEEVQRRLEEYRSGRAGGVSREDVASKARRLLR